MKKQLGLGAWAFVLGLLAFEHIVFWDYLPLTDDARALRTACLHNNVEACEDLGLLAIERQAAWEFPQVLSSSCESGAGECIRALSAATAVNAERSRLRSERLSRRYMRLACNLGSAVSCFDYAWLLRERSGTIEGATWREFYTMRSCELGWAFACAQRYDNGESVSLYSAEGREAIGAWSQHEGLSANEFQQLQYAAASQYGCEQNDVGACFWHGAYLFHGFGVEQDTVLGLEYIERVCASGVEEACAFAARVD